MTDTPTPERGEPDRFEITPDFLPKRPQDFPEDFSHENGNYQCRCYRCGHYFVGHKRRVTCKLCVTIDALRAECARKDAEIARLRGALKDLYERMDCSLCRTSPDFAFCGGCIADRERARTLLNPGAPRDGE